MKKLSCHDAHIYAFDKNAKPALKVDNGAVVEIETFDCFANQVDENTQLGALDWARINPVTGPIYINHAQKGDVLKVSIQKIDVAQQGVTMTGSGIGVMGDELQGMTHKVLKIEDEHVVFNERLKLPLNKMIGVIGVAPQGEPIACGVPDTHGGNMDNKLIAEGATVYLPVFVEGALFALGDFHAAMGDGEVCGSGVEVSGKATVKLELIKGLSIANPVVENATHIAFIASKKTLDEATKTAAQDAIRYIQQVTKLSLEDAIMLMSIAGHAEICQVVDPLITARFMVPKSVLKAYGVGVFLS